LLCQQASTEFNVGRDLRDLDEKSSHSRGSKPSARANPKARDSSAARSALGRYFSRPAKRQARTGHLAWARNRAVAQQDREPQARAL